MNIRALCSSLYFDASVNTVISDHTRTLSLMKLNVLGKIVDRRFYFRVSLFTANIGAKMVEGT
jgi:hypothetical protein